MCSLLGRGPRSQVQVHSETGGLPLKQEMRPVEWYLSFRPAAFLTAIAQLVRDPWTFYSFGLRSVESVLAAVLAPFLHVEVDANHGRISELLEV